MQTMRIFGLLSLCILPSAWGDSGSPDPTPAPPTVATPTAAPPPAPASCSVCAGAEALVCQGPGFCQCGPGIIGPPPPGEGPRSCTFSDCCQTVSSCCPGDNTYICGRSSCQCIGGGGFCRNFNTCCGELVAAQPPSTRNLRESSDMVFEVGHPGIKGYEHFCGPHDFEIALYVDKGHLVSVTTPLEGATQVGCPYMAAHAVFTEGSSTAEKQLLVWYQEPVFEQDLHTIGVFKGADLVKAFNEVDASGDGVFNYLTNNCADFQINMASKLGIKVDRDVTTFVTRRFMEDSGKKMIERIKSNANFSSFFGHRSLRADDMSDEELVQEVVEQRASKLL